MPRISPSGNSNNSSAQVKEKHQWQFRDQTVPARLFQMLRDKVITAKDLMLIFVINSLVRPQGAQDGLGCYATNEYLGRAIGAHALYVSRRIRHLSKIGLVLIVYHEDRRYLECEWSRTAEERQALVGGYGKVCQEAHRKLLRRLKEQAGKAQEEGGGVNFFVNPPLSAEVNPPLNQKVNHNNNDKTEGVEKHKKTGCPSGNGVLRGFGLDQNGSREEGRWAEGLASRIHQGLKDKGKLQRRPSWKVWSAAINAQVDLLAQGKDKYRSEVRDYLARIAEDHIAHIQDRNHPRYYSATSMFDCGDRFLRMEAAYLSRYGKEAPAPEPIQTSPEAQEVLRRFNLTWTNPTAAEQFPGAVQASLDAYNRFWSSVDALLKRKDADRELASLASYLRRAKCGDAAFFVEQWFRRVWKSVEGWDEWSGSLQSYIWTADSKRAGKECREWSVKWGAPAEAWDQLVKEVGCNR